MDNTKQHKIFIISDVLLFTSIMIDILTSLNYKVDHAEDDQTGINKIKKMVPDLILIDMDLLSKPEGIHFIRAIKSNPSTQESILLVIHSNRDAEFQEQLKSLGVKIFIKKTMDEKSLVREINGFFGHAEIPLDEVFEQYHKAYDTEPYFPEIDSKYGYLRFWGTRGSTPISKQNFMRHGGNTSCLEYRYDDHVLIFDAGSGIVDLGNQLAEEPPKTIHLFITHTHWDHIQGFPFFYPAFLSDFEINIYGVSSLDSDLGSVLKEQQNRDYFPVQFDSMKAIVNFIDIGKQPSVEIGDLTVTWEHTYHPGASVGYKVEYHGKKIAYLGDNEFLPGYRGAPHHITNDSFLTISCKDLIHFINEVDILICEAQYTNNEYPKKIGWGHTSVSNGCLLAKLGNVKKWIVIHHDPFHDDEFLQDKLILTKQIINEIGHPIDVINAYDGMIEYI